jgi:hypothetical protein
MRLHSRDANDDDLQAAEDAASPAVSAAVAQTIAAGAAAGVVRVFGRRLALARRLDAAENRQADRGQQRQHHAARQEGDERRLEAHRLNAKQYQNHFKN